MLYVVRVLYRFAQRYKGRERSRQRTEVRPENLFGVCVVPFVCLFLLNFARVDKCLFWYAVNRQISLCGGSVVMNALDCLFLWRHMTSCPAVWLAADIVP